MHKCSRRSKGWLAMHSGRIMMEPTVGWRPGRLTWPGSDCPPPLMQPMCISLEGCHPRGSMCITTMEPTVGWHPARFDLARL